MLSVKPLLRQALKMLPDLNRLEEQLASEPHKLLSAGFESGGVVPSTASGGLEGLPAAAPASRLRSAFSAVEDAVAQTARSAVSKLRKDKENAELTPDEQFGLEAIVLLVGRPAILIQNGAFMPPPTEWQILNEHREDIEKIFRSVGRIELDGHPALEWVGTGSLVGPDVILTNRHVAKEFCRQKGQKWTFEPGMKPRIDYTEDLGAAKPLEFKLTEVIGIHDEYDLALLKVARKSSQGKMPDPLVVSSAPVPLKKGRKVYVVGYPASDSRRNDPDEMRRIFVNIFDVKRLQPGEVAKLLPKDGLFYHDCSTLGGNSGSPVIDLDTHEIIGLHFSGRYRVANQAIDLAKLKKDPLLKKGKVQFA